MVGGGAVGGKWGFLGKNPEQLVSLTRWMVVLVYEAPPPELVTTEVEWKADEVKPPEETPIFAANEPRKHVEQNCALWDALAARRLACIAL